MKKIVIILFSLLLFACETEKSITKNTDDLANTQTPSILANEETIDFNQDGIDDCEFILAHIATTDIPVSAQTLSLELNPFENYLPYNSDDYLFYCDSGAIIQENPGDQYQWSSYPGYILGISYHLNNGWDNTRNGNWMDSHDKYLPFALSAGDSLYLGWIQMSITISSNSAIVEIESYNFSHNSGIPIYAGD